MLPIPPAHLLQAAPERSLQDIATRIQAQQKAKDWPGVVATIEGLGPSQRGAFLFDWLVALRQTKRWDRMLQICDAAIPLLEDKKDPRAIQVKEDRAYALGALGQHAKAMEAFAELAVIGPLGPLMWNNACSEARQARDWWAMESYADSYLAGKETGEALAWKGEAIARQERFAEAEPVLRKAVALDPKQAYAWNNLGRCAFERKAWAEAKEDLDKALALDASMMEAYFNRGRAGFELKRYPESASDFKRALALNPGDKVVADNLHQAERYAAAAAKGRGK